MTESDPLSGGAATIESKSSADYSSKPLGAPVLFLIFNRPEVTARSFASIRKACPPRLYVAGDGPRSNVSGELDRVEKAREVATAVDWPCEVSTLFRGENLGCKLAVSGAIDWFFKNEDSGIILEDDCVPEPTFFWFCDLLLERYRDDSRISVITGDNFQDGQHRGQSSDSYYFSKFAHCWGWATWRRAWSQYDGSLSFWPEWRESADWKRAVPSRIERSYWEEIFELVYNSQIDSWAYPWMASVWFHDGMTATPNVNLVKNIGFGADSTHTTSEDSALAAMKTESMKQIQHPDRVSKNIVADRYVFENTLEGKYRRFPLNLARRVYRFLTR